LVCCTKKIWQPWSNRWRALVCTKASAGQLDNFVVFPVFPSILIESKRLGPENNCSFRLLFAKALLMAHTPLLIVLSESFYIAWHWNQF
jgi:hypothetical protein